MPDIKSTLQDRDLGFLKIIAELWGVDFFAEDSRSGIVELIRLILDDELIQEVVGALPNGAQSALFDLVQNEGKLPWLLFSRRYGNIEAMGQAKRDREKPYMDPDITPSEMLWYRGLVGRAFFDTQQGPVEHAYLPDEFLSPAHHYWIGRR